LEAVVLAETFGDDSALDELWAAATPVHPTHAANIRTPDVLMAKLPSGKAYQGDNQLV
jgi:hypothetical protein